METLHDDRRHNFTIIDNEVLTDYSLTAYELAVYVVLASHTRNGTAFPGLNRIASIAGCSKPTAIKAIKGLENKNLIKVVRNKGENGEHENNEYRILPVKKKGGSKGDLPGVVKEIDHNHTIEDISSKDDMGNSVSSLPKDTPPSAQNEKDKEAPPPDAAPPPPRHRQIFGLVARRSFGCDPKEAGGSKDRIGRIASSLRRSVFTLEELEAGYDFFKEKYPDLDAPRDAAKILDWAQQAKNNGQSKGESNHVVSGYETI